MNTKAIISMILNIAAIILFTVSIILYSTGYEGSLGTVFLCIGNVFLISGIFMSRKERKESENNAEQSKADENKEDKAE